MRKFICLLVTILLYSCDPNSCVEEKISNLSDTDITITWHFIEETAGVKTVQINRNQTKVI